MIIDGMVPEECVGGGFVEHSSSQEFTGGFRIGQDGGEMVEGQHLGGLRSDDVNEERLRWLSEWFSMEDVGEIAKKVRGSSESQSRKPRLWKVESRNGVSFDGKA